MELYSFLGLASYYHWFIPKYTAVTECLQQSVGPTNNKKNKRAEPLVNQTKGIISWTGDHQKAFNLLKANLTSMPVLAYMDFSLPFELETDPSLQGLGAVLSQRDENGKGCVIAYVSWSLHPNEQLMQNYSLVKLEILVLRWAVRKKLKDYHFKFQVQHIY